MPSNGFLYVGRLCGPRKRRYVTTTADSDMEHGDIPEDYQMLMSKSSTDNSISTLRSDSHQVSYKNICTKC